MPDVFTVFLNKDDDDDDDNSFLYGIPPPPPPPRLGEMETSLLISSLQMQMHMIS